MPLPANKFFDETLNLKWDDRRATLAPEITCCRFLFELIYEEFGGSPEEQVDLKLAMETLRKLIAMDQRITSSTPQVTAEHVISYLRASLPEAVIDDVFLPAYHAVMGGEHNHIEGRKPAIDRTVTAMDDTIPAEPSFDPAENCNSFTHPARLRITGG